jgi:hypothetical protein
MVLFNMNVCRNNLDDIRMLTEYAREHRIATDYHINETPMIEQDEHFKHMNDNPTYIRPRRLARDGCTDRRIIEKNKAGYQMVNSIQRLQEMKAFIRMVAGADLRTIGWDGDGTRGWRYSRTAELDAWHRPRKWRLSLYRLELPCRAGLRDYPHGRNHCALLPHVCGNTQLGKHRNPQVRPEELSEMKQRCQQHCFSTLNHNLSYCYNDARVIKWLWNQAKNGLRGGLRSFED